MNFGVHDALVLYLEEVKKLLDDVIHKLCAPVGTYVHWGTIPTNVA